MSTLDKMTRQQKSCLQVHHIRRAELKQVSCGASRLQNAQENLTTNFQSGWPFSGLWEKTKSKKRRQKESNKPPRVQQLAALVTSQVR